LRIADHSVGPHSDHGGKVSGKSGHPLFFVIEDMGVFAFFAFFQDMGVFAFHSLSSVMRNGVRRGASKKWL